uniref:Uncharacterized protein n=1 Tax=Timema genevievae TaxID=629358 RepID=A0A7R9K6G6_TIMGE|nr:unnamed protein product [Timema genevievae]
MEVGEIHYVRIKVASLPLSVDEWRPSRGRSISDRITTSPDPAVSGTLRTFRREDNELQSASHHVLTLDGEVLTLNGKLLAGHVLIGCNDQEDQVSVCSCTCLGPASCHNHLLSLEPGYHPTMDCRQGQESLCVDLPTTKTTCCRWSLATTRPVLLGSV